MAFLEREEALNLLTNRSPRQERSREIHRLLRGKNPRHVPRADLQPTSPASSDPDASSHTSLRLS